MVLGGTGTIGRATVRALVHRGHEVVCFVRAYDGVRGARTAENLTEHLQGATVRFGEITDARSIALDGFCGETFDVLVSCLASRTGTCKHAWAIDHQAHVDALVEATKAGISHMVLLSAICVQKPVLEFQRAKLAFEAILIESGITYSIVRPTAYFKSLSGQIERLKAGKPFLIFGDGMGTACKPISDDDLGRYLADCLEDVRFHNRVLPIGGPGDAITPKQQGERLFALLGREPKFRRVPVALLDIIVWTLAACGHVLPSLAEKAELARIGRSTGSETLFDYYARVIEGKASVERGEHAVF
jgi:divinyl chlorophyllide a 8-vinyl-reductase